MELLRQSLAQLGISENGIELYLFSYKVGRTSIGKLAKAIGMDRSSAYLAHEQLAALGLMQTDIVKGIKEVWSSPPASVIKIIRDRLDGLKSGADEITAHLPELLAQYGADDERPVLQSFSGRDSLHRITADILGSQATEIRIITNQNAERKVFSSDAHENFIHARIRKGMKALVLAADTPEAQVLKKYDTKELRETKIQPGLIPFKSEVYIYGNKVAVLGFAKSIFGFIVQADEFADLQRYLFDQSWGK